MLPCDGGSPRLLRALSRLRCWVGVSSTLPKGRRCSHPARAIRPSGAATALGRWRVAPRRRRVGDSRSGRGTTCRTLGCSGTPSSRRAFGPARRRVASTWCWLHRGTALHWHRVSDVSAPRGRRPVFLRYICLARNGCREGWLLGPRGTASRRCRACSIRAQRRLAGAASAPRRRCVGVSRPVYSSSRWTLGIIYCHG